MPLLEVTGLRTGYGQVPVLHGVDLSVQEGETAVIMGLNGAGKTTALMSIAGLLRPRAGEITYEGRRIDGLDARKLVARGLALVPEGRRVFPALSVRNNLRMGAWPHRRDRGRIRRDLDLVYEIFPRLEERREQLAGTLSGGEQQMLALGRGLMTGPRLLLIDEASLGLSPKLAGEVFATIRRINGEGVTVLIVEQNAGVLDIAARAYVMQKGRIELERSGRELLQEGELRKAYLGAPA